MVFRHLRYLSTAGYDLVPDQSSPADSGRPLPSSDHPLLALESPTELAAFYLPTLSALVRQLRAPHRIWTPQAGISARLVIEGATLSTVPSPVVPFRTVVYVVLQSPGCPSGFWTTSYNTYSQFVFSRGSVFHEDTVSHSFGSRAEAEAYLEGAGLGWPVRR